MNPWPGYKCQKGDNYGIPDFSRRRSSDGALRTNHHRLYEAARMVTANRNEEVIKMDTLSTPLTSEEKHAHNEIAAVLSIVPGLGHIYKGHIFAGLLWMIGAIPVGIFVFLAAFASAGWGLGLFLFYLAAAMLHAYGIEDRVVPPKEDEGEEY